MAQAADFFVSYTGADRAWAEWIAWQLEAEGYNVVVQAWDFIPGHDWTHEMHEATRTAERVVAVLSAAYLQSAHGEAEWQVFYAKDPRGLEGRLLPVRIEEVEPPGLLTTRIYVDLVGRDGESARAVLLAAVRGARGKPMEAPEFPGCDNASSQAPRFPGDLPPVSNVPFHLNSLLAANCWVDEATGWLPRVAQAPDPVALGVHPAAELDEAQLEEPAVHLLAGVPVYVPRDKDAELDTKLAHCGFVLLVGDSTAGKSRTAYQAICRLFSQRWLLVPDTRASLKALVDSQIEFRETVIWLNDLERWLGPEGLDLWLLRRLLGDGRRQVVVVATMRSSEYTTRSTEPGQDRSSLEWELRRSERELLDQASRVELERWFTESERQRAEQRAWDPRIADALAHADSYGLAEYIAAAPRLWKRWRDGRAVDNPMERLAGAAIVSAAVDCRRAGLARPVPEALLRDLYLGYLDTPIVRQLGGDAFSAGLRWAMKPVQATSALLVQDEHGYFVFDYLVDRVQTDSLAPPVPDVTWIRLLQEVNAGDAFAVGFGAVGADRRLFAEQAWRKAAEVGHRSAENNLGVLLARQGRPREAEHWLRKAATTGHHGAEYNLGLLLVGQGRTEEAEQWFRKAATTGHRHAENSLGVLLARQGRSSEAEHWLRKAATAGYHRAEYNLGRLLVNHGRILGAKPWLRKAARAGHYDAEAAARAQATLSGLPR